MPAILVTYRQDASQRAAFSEALNGAAEVVYLPDLEDGKREAALRSATIVLARNTARDLRPHEAPLLTRARLIQFITAGIDFVPLNDLPAGVPIASNGGAYAEPMAEHALAMAFAAAKRLLVEHAALRAGDFNQHKPNRMLAGGVCGILGFGGIGVATARLMRAVGMRVHAINRRGASDEPIDWIGTPDRLGELLDAADVLVVATPLSRQTQGMIGALELARLKSDAILINLARGEVIDEAALFAHLKATPSFTACIDAWWIEPVRHGSFRMDHPFLSLPNVIGSPHNSASVAGVSEAGLRRAAINIRRVLNGEAPHYVVGVAERMM